jgi:hypothetical protein
MHWLQKGATSLLVIALSSIIFFVLISDKQTRKSVLRPTLEALGEQLFAAVRDDSQKGQLEENYKDFVRSAEMQEIDSQDVEKVAAKILNLSSRDSVISSRDAMQLLADIAEAAPEVASTDSAKNVNESAQASIRAKTGFRISRIAPPSWSKEDLAARLKAMQELQHQMAHLSRDSSFKGKARQKYRFQPSDSGLRVFVDVKMLDSLTPRDSLLESKLRELEKKQWLEWRHAGPPPPPPGGSASGPSPSVPVHLGIAFLGAESDGPYFDGIVIDSSGGAWREAGVADSVKAELFGKQMAAWGLRVAKSFVDSAALRKLEQLSDEQVLRAYSRDAAPASALTPPARKNP